MIKNIVFDIGDVLVGYDGRSYLKSFGFSPEKEQTILCATFRSPYWPELDREAIPLPELMEAFCSLAPPEYREDIFRVFEGAHRSICPWPESLPWIQSLKERGYGVYYLSNYSSLMVERTRDALGFLPYMDGGLFSYEVKQVKPEPEIYEAFVERFPQIQPEEAVFLDNSEENVKAAEAFGFHGIVFRDREQAMEELDQLLRTENGTDPGGENGPV